MPTIRIVVTSRVPGVTRQVREAAALAVQKGAYDVEANAKRFAPVLTGLLRNSIQTHRLDSLTWEVESPVHYSVFQEYGTRYMSAQPYMTPAALIVGRSLETVFKRLVP
jgi:HK97 gp10 family phage protein